MTGAIKTWTRTPWQAKMQLYIAGNNPQRKVSEFRGADAQVKMIAKKFLITNIISIVYFWKQTHWRLKNNVRLKK